MRRPAVSSEEFGPELRRRRIAAGLTLTRLAELLSYSKGHLSKIERGHKAPPPEFARRCDAQLDAAGALERLLPAEPRPSQSARSGRSGLSARDSRDIGEQGAGAPPFRGEREDVRRPEGLGRRRLLAAGATSLLGAGLAGPLTSIPPATVPTTPSPATPVADSPVAESLIEESAPVEIFRAQFDQMRRLGQTTAPSTQLPKLTAQTHTLGQLAARAGTANRSRLLALAARFAEYAGWMAQEAGDDATALSWTARAVEFAEAGGDHHLASYALVRRALVTFYAGDATRTVQLVEAAQAGHLPPRIRGLAAQREAQGHALTGDRDACLRSLDRARELLAAADAESGTGSGHGDGAGAPVLGTTSLADPAAMVTGWCLHDLGRPAQAAEVLDREYLRIPAHAIRSRARYGIRRALAHAANGQPEHAGTLAAELLPLVPGLHSATIRADVRRLARELHRFRADRTVRDIEPLLARALHP
ncbi:helix-turn-helix transcriptional regulator [Kitasatospora sp. NPDC093558]|uniref:helix-turn-helix domain-containing protein n=1 Tax=Kitasatospora sp. NPDC093558 TaxID=3155201 RepID=UPI003426BA0F